MKLKTWFYSTRKCKTKFDPQMYTQQTKCNQPALCPNNTLPSSQILKNPKESNKDKEIPDTGWKISRRANATPHSEIRSSKHTYTSIQEAGIHQLAIAWEHCMRDWSSRLTWDPLQNQEIIWLNYAIPVFPNNKATWIKIRNLFDTI